MYWTRDRETSNFHPPLESLQKTRTQRDRVLCKGKAEVLETHVVRFLPNDPRERDLDQSLNKLIKGARAQPMGLEEH